MLYDSDDDIVLAETPSAPARCTLYDSDDEPVRPKHQTSAESSPSSCESSYLPSTVPSKSSPPARTMARGRTVAELGHFYLNSNLSSDAPAFYWDMAKDPIFFLRDTVSWDQPFVIHEAAGHKPSPPGTEVTLSFSKELDFPWEITVPITNGTECTIKQAFYAIYEGLQKLVSKETALEMNKQRKRIVFDARMKRCSDLELDTTKEPLRRIDFLCASRRLVGVTTIRGHEGVFKIHTGTLPTSGIN